MIKKDKNEIIIEKQNKIINAYGLLVSELIQYSTLNIPKNKIKKCISEIVDFKVNGIIGRNKNL